MTKQHRHYWVAAVLIALSVMVGAVAYVASDVASSTVVAQPDGN